MNRAHIETTVRRATILLDALPHTHPLPSGSDPRKTRRLMLIKQRVGRIVDMQVQNLAEAPF